MLIEFSVSNYRSFRERQTFSMVAAPRLRKRENTFKPDLLGENFPSLLKVAVIYGPNASGKSNLLKALNAVRNIASNEPHSRDTPLPVAPFRFDPELASKPSEFELHFIQSGVRYQFNLSATSERVTEEQLIAFPRGKETLLYSRIHTPDGEKYYFGEKMEASDDLRQTWKNITPPKLLFIAQAVANSSEEQTQLKAPFAWLTHSMLSILNGMDGMTSAAQRLAQKNSYHSTRIASFLQEVDVPISGIEIKTLESPQPILNFSSDPSNSGENSLSVDPPPPRSVTLLTHKTALGEGTIALRDESEGTKNLIGFWLPWATKDPSGNHDRCVLIVDELDSSLHPKIVATLVAKHIEAPVPSQLIFTTHDTHLMDAKLLRRDQFWITERNANGATELRSIHDFEGRESEDIEKRYYEGRYRGLPFVTKKD